MSETELAKLEFRTDDGEVETLWAKPVGQNLFQLDNSPFYAYGVSSNDVVEAEPQPGAFPLFKRVVRKSGHRTVRVIIDGLDELGRLTVGIKKLGCSFEGAWSKLISVDVPPGVALEDVRSFLILGRFEWEHADPTYEQLFGAGGPAEQ
jgi:hypothetical protein